MYKIVFRINICVILQVLMKYSNTTGSFEDFCNLFNHKFCLQLVGKVLWEWQLICGIQSTKLTDHVLMLITRLAWIAIAAEVYGPGVSNDVSVGVMASFRGLTRRAMGSWLQNSGVPQVFLKGHGYFWYISSVFMFLWAVVSWPLQ